MLCLIEIKENRPNYGKCCCYIEMVKLITVTIVLKELWLVVKIYTSFSISCSYFNREFGTVRLTKIGFYDKNRNNK